MSSNTTTTRSSNIAKPFKCEKCDRCYTKQGSVTRHLKMACKKDKTSPSYNILQKPSPVKARRFPILRSSLTEKLHVQEKACSPTYTCRICPYEAWDRRNLRGHYKSYHAGEGYWKCPYCISSFNLQLDLISHFSGEHPWFNYTDPVMCKVCQFEAKTSIHLVSHEAMSHKLLTQEKRRNDSLSSINTVESDHEQSCDVCDSKFESLKLFNLHNLEVHTF